MQIELFDAYLYPPGTLLGKAPVAAAPIEYEGEVTMTNLVGDAPVVVRSATCQLNDLGTPRIDLLPGNTVPAPSGELSQVILRFATNGVGDLPVFHSAEQHPKMRLGVDYHEVDRDEGDDRPQVSRHKHEWLAPAEADEWIAPVEADEPLPEYQAPHHLTMRSTLRVPSQELYRSDIRKQLNYVLTPVPDVTGGSRRAAHPSRPQDLDWTTH